MTANMNLRNVNLYLRCKPRSRARIGSACNGRFGGASNYAWATIMLIACSVVAATGVMAQDPFAVTPNPAASAPATAASSDQLPPIELGLDKSRRLIVETTRKADPQSAQALATSIKTLLDIDQFVDANYYLARLSKLELDDAALFDLNAAIGSDFFFRIHSQPQIQPFGQQFARKIFAAGDRFANDPVRLDELIRKLNDTSHVARQHAFSQLKRVGPNAAAAMIRVFTDSSRGGEFAAIRNALRSMGDLAIDPLLASVNANDIQVRYESLLALARVRTPDAFDSVLRALYASDTPAAIREAVEQALISTYGELPDQATAIDRVFRRANDRLLGRDRTMNQVKFDLNSAQVIAWRWDFANRQLVSELVSPETFGRLLALDRAADLVHLYPERNEFRQFFLLAYFDAAKRLVGPDRHLTATDVQKDLGKLDAFEIDRTLLLALDKNLIPAAAGACDLLAEVGKPELLATNQRPTNGLTRAIQSGDRHTQFSAFRAIAKIDPQQGYPGSSQVLSAAVFFAGYGDRPSALIGHNRVATARNLSVALGSAGVSSRSVDSGREFFNEAISDSNIRYLFLSDSLSRPDYLELVQQVRADWRTKRVPIVILIERDNMARAERLAQTDARMLVLPLTLDEGSVVRQVERLKKLFDPWELTNEQGISQGDFAVQWLQKIFRDRQAYQFYNIGDHQQFIADLIFSPMQRIPSIELLGALGTPLAQRNLIGFASQEGLPLEHRQAAVQAFGLAIKSHGVLLTSEEIRQQYQRYKSSENQPGEVQRVLGSILDLIEHHAAAGSPGR